MNLGKHSRFGPYEVVAPIGSGGMGEIYRARDPRLNREVALKVLHEEVFDGPGHRARFAAEARAVAALSHPNIVAIFDFGEEQGMQYTVSELIEGESLRALLHKGPVAVRKLIDIAVQMADGLCAAHSVNITHRDLKPENIMITGDGRVKILDFGLARRANAAGAVAGSAGDSTLTVHTQAGTILGTPGYMSPEQARGGEADYRSDQFSFGLIVYELATGKKAFQRDSTVETLAAIVRDEPPPIETKLPPSLRWTIERCLAKDPSQRFESTRDLYQDLRALRDHLSESLTVSSAEAITATAGEGSKLRAWRPWMEGAVLLALAGAILLAVRASRGQDISKYRYTPFAMNSDAAPYGPHWSPDGNAIGWTELVCDHQQVLVRYLNSQVPVQVTHEAEWAQFLGWSPDGKRLLFSKPATDPGRDTANAIYSAAIVGGEPYVFATLPDYLTVASISPDNRTVAGVGRKENGRYQVWYSSPAGSPFREYAPSPFASSALYNRTSIRFSPDGKKILLIRTGESQSEEAWLLPFPPGEPRRVFTHLPMRRVHGSFDWMPDSRHVMITLRGMDASERSHIFLLDTASSDTAQVTGGTNDQMDASVSRDGRRLVFSENKNDLDIVNLSLNEGTPARFIATDLPERMPAWSAQTAKMAYVTNRNGGMEIWLRNSEGEDHPLVTASNFSDGGTRFFMDPVLSPNGETLAFSRMNEAGELRAWVMQTGTGVPERLHESGTETEYVADWSPDGTRVLELIVDNGRESLSVVKLGERGNPTVIREGVLNLLPAWSPAGEWITYFDKNGWNLTSPDGKTRQNLGHINTPYLMFSRDGKRLYGIRNKDTENKLFALDLAARSVTDMRDVGKEFAPASDYNPGIRFTLTPDGKSITYASGTYKADLWLLEGFQQPGWFARLFR